VLANRLTEDGRTRVLLLEAGPRDSNPWIHVPLGYGKLFTNKTVNWSYESEPEPELGGRRIFTPRGKVLGGSSSINGLVYLRGQPEDFDGWGVPGWGWKDLLPYFIKAEDQSHGASAYHGAGGPLGVSDLERHELADAFIASAQAMGIPRNYDFNGATQEGAGYYQATVKNGRRSSTATGYLRPAEKRANLHVEVNALATQILFDGRRATGVTFTQNGRTRSVHANEIILAGGSINTPQLLQLSGVGPAELLQKLGIPVVLDAPGVGEDMQDHFYVRTFWKCNKPVTLNDDMANPLRQLWIGMKYAFGRSGPLSIAAGHAAAIVKTRPELPRPDAQLYFINFSTAKRGGHLHPFSGFTCSVSQMQSDSRGSVRIRSADPAVAPEIRYNYLTAEKDRRMMVDGLKLLRRLVNTKPLADFVIEEAHPGPRVQTDEDWLQFCRESGETVFHPTSTCRMGGDARAVVDANLNVRGIGGLRVVDASIMPSVPSANTNASVIAVAEKAADVIRGDRA
jgi:choline dehydrogenase